MYSTSARCCRRHHRAASYTIIYKYTSIHSILVHLSISLIIFYSSFFVLRERIYTFDAHQARLAGERPLCVPLKIRYARVQASIFTYEMHKEHYFTCIASERPMMNIIILHIVYIHIPSFIIIMILPVLLFSSLYVFVAFRFDFVVGRLLIFALFAKRSSKMHNATAHLDGDNIPLLLSILHEYA